MDFIIIANAWSAGKDNPTSKHRIAIELVRQGHQVLWIEGSGMRTPSVGSSSDRLRMVRKILASLKGARRETTDYRPQTADLSGASGGRGLSEPQPQDGSYKVRPPKEFEVCGLKSEVPTPLHVLSPLFVPLPRYELVRRLNGLICRWSMRFWGWRLGFRDPVLINYVPVLAEAMCGAFAPVGRGVPVEPSSADGRPVHAAHRDGSPYLNCDTLRLPRIIYHCVDRWDAFAMYDSVMMGAMDRQCCRYADLVIASAGELYERCKAINPNTVLIPHGVDWEHFRRGTTEKQLLSCQVAKLPPSGQGGEKSCSVVQLLSKSPEDTLASTTQQLNNPTTNRASGGIIGFFGLLSEWVDQELILKLAQEFPCATIKLIGKADVDVTRLKGIPNIQLPGPKPFSELPEIVAGFTVGIIPFVVNDLTRSVNPIKLREMLSAGCPVVSTNLPEVARYQHLNNPPLSGSGLWGGCPHPPVTGAGGKADGDIRPTARESGGTSAPVWGGCPHPPSSPQADEDIRPTAGRGSPPPVQIAHHHDEFVASVRRVLEHPYTPEERRVVSDSMAGETWSAKVREILSLITNN